MSTFSTTVEHELKKRVAGDCLFDLRSRESFAADESWYKITPVGVVQPKDVHDVQEVLEYCYEHEIPVIPRGGASGLAGQAIGMGIILDFARYMTQILEIHERWVRVMPGVVLNNLNEKLAERDLLFPIDPASGNRCTIGGMIGTNAAGAHGVKYGAMKDVVRDLTVVFSNGEVATIDATNTLPPRSFAGTTMAGLAQLLPPHHELIRQRFPKVAKNSSGYNLRDSVTADGVDFRKLFVGSEGTLAIVVNATLDVIPLPPCRAGALVYFDSYEKSLDATLVGLELDPSAVEMLDSTYVSLAAGMNAEIDSLLLKDARVMLYFEFEGESARDVHDRVLRLNRALLGTRPLKFLPLNSSDERKTLWQLREQASAIINERKERGKTSFIEDVAVPLHALPEYVSGLARILHASGIDFSLYGHAGTGNVHCAAFIDLKNPDHYRAVDRIATDVYALARSLGGTHSGEHGDGFVRTPFLEDLYGSEIYRLFRSIKDGFDPKGILNPGKIIGQQRGTILHDLDLS